MAANAPMTTYAKERARKKIAKTMGEYKRGALHSGSKHGPIVKSRKQAIAIAMNQSRRRK